MLKKKLNILFVILLSVLFLGLSSTTYASSFTANNVVNAFNYLKQSGYLSSFDTSRVYNNIYSFINNNQFESFAIYKLKDSVTTVDNKIILFCYYSSGSVNTQSSGSGRAFKSTGQLYDNSTINNTKLTVNNIELAYSPNTNLTNLYYIMGDIYDINAPSLDFTQIGDVKPITILNRTTNCVAMYYNTMDNPILRYN